MTIQARYPGTCPECGGRWQPGDPIDTAEPGNLSKWKHAVCPDTPSDFEHHAPVCTPCWLSHPEGACDR